ncbi:hypothetical protein ABC347_12535 [Sphingomonas sp. 1P06PA]|uniref:hypothetical protein n=1 Tax=Sphingomonas sp. 1P06PA TaxID=554121 RepID=UPI0039A5B3FF
MRILTALLAAIALALPAVAPAAIRATYGSTEPGRTLVVEVADNGEARIGEAGAPDYGILRDGHFHIVGRAGDGVTVARIEDVAAAIDRVMAPIFGTLLDNARDGRPATVTLRSQRRGTRTVGGRTGQVIAVYGLNSDLPGVETEFVFSDDPALKPLGRALEGFMNAAMLPAAPVIGKAAAETIDQTRALFAFGTPLVAGKGLVLQSIETVDLPAARFELPSRPASVDQLVAAMKAAPAP